MLAARPPLHREAYPRLDIHAALSAYRSDQPVCVFIDQAGRRIGLLRIQPAADGQTLSVWGELGGQNVAVWNSVMTLLLVSSPTGIDPMRKLFRCPHCERATRSLVRTQHWACPGCDGLLHRSQLVHSSVRLMERLDKLNALIKHGRPKGMHQRTYDRYCKQTADIRQAVKGQRVTMPCPDHSRRVTSHWLSEQQAYHDPTLGLYRVPDRSPPPPTRSERGGGASGEDCAAPRHFDRESLSILPSDEDFPDPEDGSLLR